MISLFFSRQGISSTKRRLCTKAFAEPGLAGDDSGWPLQWVNSSKGNAAIIIFAWVVRIEQSTIYSKGLEVLTTEETTKMKTDR